MDKAKLDIERRLVPEGANVVRHLSLPSQGKSLDWILAEMDKMDTELDDSAPEQWRLGKLSGAVYRKLILCEICFTNNNIFCPDGGDDLSKLIVAAYARYCVSNPLHPEVFPAVRKMEAEIVAMCLRMYRAPEGSAGTMTSGGTESIIMSIKTYRDWARKVKGIIEPEMFVSLKQNSLLLNIS